MWLEMNGWDNDSGWMWGMPWAEPCQPEPTGEWRNNKRHGMGTFSYAPYDGRKIYGEWAEGQLISTVVATYPDGTRCSHPSLHPLPSLLLDWDTA